MDTKFAFKYLSDEELYQRKLIAYLAQPNLKFIRRFLCIGACFHCSDTKCRKDFLFLRG